MMSRLTRARKAVREALASSVVLRWPVGTVHLARGMEMPANGSSTRTVRIANRAQRTALCFQPPRQPQRNRPTVGPALLDRPPYYVVPLVLEIQLQGKLDLPRGCGSVRTGERLSRQSKGSRVLNHVAWLLKLRMIE